MRKLNSKLKTEFISERGNDSIHKTYVAYTPLNQLMCIAVAESYDNDIEINSAKLAVETVLTAFEKKPSMRKIKEYIKCANEQILLHSTINKLSVSITVIVSDYTRMRYGVCGNTKIHVFYENMISFISNTQTKYQQLLETQAESEINNEEIHNLTQYLGMKRRIKPYISKKISLEERSSLLISTSNLWGMVSDIELLDAYEEAKDDNELLYNTQELLLSRQEKEELGSYTLAVISVEKTFKEDTQKIKKRKKLCIILAIILCSILLIGAIVILIIRAVDRSKMSDIKQIDQKGTKYINYENYAKSLEEYEKADKLCENLSLNNWQYIDDKKELKDNVTSKLAILTTIIDGDICIENGNYEQAQQLYQEVQKEAKYNEESSIYDFVSEKLEMINKNIDVNQLIAFGEIYETSEDYDLAIEEYYQALEILKQLSNVEKRGEVQTKLYDAKQKAKETEEAAEEKKLEQKQSKVKKKIIKIQALLGSATKFLGESNIEEADKIYEQILSVYNGIEDSDEEVEKIYEKIVALEQALAQSKVKAQEEAVKEKVSVAQEYLMQAAEAAQKNKKEEAIKLYKKALEVYSKSNIWDDQVEKIYADIEILQQKIQEEETQEKLLKAQDYLMQAAEAVQKNKKEEAIELYKKALKIYKKLNIWDDQVEKIYADIENLQQEISDESVVVNPDEDIDSKEDSEIEEAFKPDKIKSIGKH